VKSDVDYFADAAIPCACCDISTRVANSVSLRWQARSAMFSTKHLKRWFILTLLLSWIFFQLACSNKPEGVQTDQAVSSQKFPHEKFSDKIKDNAEKMLEEGRETFRYNTFGSEAFWGDQLQLHKIILKENKGGI